MQPLTTLIVEDDMPFAIALGHMLRFLGYPVLGVATNGDEAITAARLLCPDVVLMDVRMRTPQEGIVAAAAIESTLGIPVVLVTAARESVEPESPRFHGCVLKPCHQIDMQASLEAAWCCSDGGLRPSRLEQLDKPAICADEEGRVTLLNGAAQELTGWSAAEATGMDIDAVLPLAYVSAEATAAALCRCACLQRYTITATRRELQGRDGVVHSVQVCVAALLVRDRAPQGALVMLQAMTAS